MPPDRFRIRDATAADIPAIGAIYRPEVERGLSSWEEEPPSDADLMARMEKILRAGLPYLAAERDGAVVGYAYAGPYHTRSAYRYTLEDTVYIRPDAQGQGAGKALMAELLARAEAAGCRQMMALIRSVEGSPSIALHEKFGFRMIGRANGLGYKFGGWLDLAFMQKPLGAANAAPPDRPAVGRRT